MTRASGEGGPCVSSTTRYGSRGQGASRRTVSAGSSRSTVPTPTRMASDFAAQAMRLQPRRLAGDPPRGAVDVGDLAVERHGDLQGDVRPALAHRGEEGPVLPLGLGAQQPDLDLDARLAQQREAPPGHARDWDRRGPRRPGDTRRARRAGAHGGVRPWWAHGSSVT